MRVKLADTSWRTLVNLASKCGFVIYEGGPYTKVKTKEGKFVTTIPRHSQLEKAIVRGILKKFRQFGCQL